MSELTVDNPLGVLLPLWNGSVGDYAIAGGWACDGEWLIVGDAAGSIYGFDGGTGAIRWKHVGIHDGGVLAMAIHPGGQLFATVGQDGRLLVWNAADGRVRRTIELGRGWVEHVAWSGDGQLVAASMSRRVHVFDLDGKEVWQSEEHPSTVSAITWSGADELATACYGRVSFFEIPSGELRQKLEWQGSLVSMVLSPDGNIVACGSQDNSVHFWRRDTGEDSQMHGYPCKPSALAFDDSGTLLGTSGGEAVTVWSFHGNGPEGTRPGVLQLHVQPITALSFAQHGFRLASGARDGAVVVWGLQQEGEGAVLGIGLVEDVVDSLFWRPDDGALAALDASGRVSVWSVADV